MNGMNDAPLAREGTTEDQLSELQDRFDEHLQDHMKEYQGMRQRSNIPQRPSMKKTTVSENIGKPEE